MFSGHIGHIRLTARGGVYRSFFHVFLDNAFFFHQYSFCKNWSWKTPRGPVVAPIFLQTCFGVFWCIWSRHRCVFEAFVSKSMFSRIRKRVSASMVFIDWLFKALWNPAHCCLQFCPAVRWATGFGV